MPLDRVHLHEVGALDAIAVEPLGGTAFQRRVWEALRAIPGLDVVRPADAPITATGGVVGLQGNLAPEGAVRGCSPSQMGAGAGAWFEASRGERTSAKHPELANTTIVEAPRSATAGPRTRAHAP